LLFQQGDASRHPPVLLGALLVAGVGVQPVYIRAGISNKKNKKIISNPVELEISALTKLFRAKKQENNF